jgi:hypothetical protein
MIVFDEIKNAFTDNRSNYYTFIKIDNNRYRLVEEDCYLEYLPHSDQYLVAENTFWDPLSGDAFFYIDGMNYNSMFDIPFIYSYDNYLSVPSLDKVSLELINFLTEVWQQKDIATTDKNLKASLEWVYAFIYLKEEKNTKKEPKDNLSIIKDLVKFTEDKLVKMQVEWSIPPNNKKEKNIQKLYEMMCNKENTDVNKAASKALNNGYYYCTINKDLLKADQRIVLNVAPSELLNALEKLWSIVNKSKAVRSMKFAGPATASKKIDNIIIYTINGIELQNLLDDIYDAKIATVNLLPSLIHELKPGIGIADEPRKIDETKISFGTKRVILATMALLKATTLEDMITLGTTYFQQAGINVENPAYDTQIVPNPAIQVEMQPFSEIWK